MKKIGCSARSARFFREIEKIGCSARSAPFFREIEKIGCSARFFEKKLKCFFTNITYNS